MSGLQIRSHADVATQDQRQLKPGETRRVPHVRDWWREGRVTQAIERVDEADRFAALSSHRRTKMSKQQLAAILEMSAQNPPPANATPAVMRAWIEDVASRLPVAGNIQIERVNCGPCDGDLISSAGGDASRLIIHYHGGGFFFGSSRTHRVIASNLARAAGSAVLVPDYRLAPENPAPTAHDDAFAVYQWALNSGDAAGKVA